MFHACGMEQQSSGRLQNEVKKDNESLYNNNNLLICKSSRKQFLYKNYVHSKMLAFDLIIISDIFTLTEYLHYTVCQRRSAPFHIVSTI